jgi:hypothetical protein
MYHHDPAQTFIMVCTKPCAFYRYSRYPRFLKIEPMISKKYSSPAPVTRRAPQLLVCFACLLAGGNALAYKVERVCETSEATGKKSATKSCKTLLVRAEGAGKADKKEEKKEAKPAAGGH